MNSRKPIVSVIIPFFNRIDWTLAAVQSVLKQSFQGLEVLLVDDGSTESVDRLQVLEDRRIRMIQQTNRGPAAARNNGMRNARGDYIAFLDSDDLFVPGKLACQVGIHTHNPEIFLSHTSYQFFRSQAERLEVVHSGRFSGYVWPRILYGCPIATSTVMLKRTVFESGIWFEEEYRVAEDIIFFSKVAAHSVIAGLDEPMTLFRVTQDTHGLDPRKQVVGTRNIMRYIASGKPGLSPSDRREVIGENHYYIAVNYWRLKRPLAYASHIARSLLVSPGRDGAVARRINAAIGRPVYRFLRSVYHSAKKDSDPHRGYWRWAVRALLGRIPRARSTYSYLRSIYQAIVKCAHPESQ